MNDVGTVALVAMIGLATTSSSIVGAALGLYVPVQKRVLACVLAFAAGSLISALAIDLAFAGAQDLHGRGFQAGSAWAFVGGGFALGAVIYYFASLILDQNGAAVRSSARFRDYVLGRKQKDSKDLIALLAKCDLLRHLPPNEIENILPLVRSRHLGNGEILFRANDPGDALYIVAHGAVDVLVDGTVGPEMPGRVLAQLGEGHAFGEMALLTGKPRMATIRAATDTSLTLMLGMFLGGIPEAAASGAMLTRAGFAPRAIFGLWSTVLLSGLVAAVAGNLLLGGTASTLVVFDQGVAGGATLAVVTHAMIPEAIHDGRSLVVLPLVAGFLFALYLSLAGSFA